MMLVMRPRGNYENDCSQLIRVLIVYEQNTLSYMTRCLHTPSNIYHIGLQLYFSKHGYTCTSLVPSFWNTLHIAQTSKFFVEADLNTFHSRWKQEKLYMVGYLSDPSNTRDTEQAEAHIGDSQWNRVIVA